MGVHTRESQEKHIRALLFQTLKKTRWPCQGPHYLLHFSPGSSSLTEGPSLAMEHLSQDTEHHQEALHMLHLRKPMNPMTILTMLLHKRMVVWILEQSWKNSSLSSSLFLPQSSWLSSSLPFFCNFRPLWLEFFPWLSPSKLPSSTLFLPHSSSSSATLTEPPSQDLSAVRPSDHSFQKESVRTKSTSLPSLLKMLLNQFQASTEHKLCDGEPCAISKPIKSSANKL